MRLPGAPLRTIAAAAALLLWGGRLFAQHDMHAMSNASGWTYAADARVNLLFDHQTTQRGDSQFALIDWEMFMAARQAGPGTLQLRAMTSMEPFVLGGSGYAELLQTGGSYRHGYLHDRMHPHDALVELSAAYETKVVRLYAAAVGEPALGPVSYMHRRSSGRDPFAPLGHHWQDASHQSYGVLSAALKAGAVELEGSAFNPREADEGHLVADFRGARLDSYSGRLTWRPMRGLAASTWWGYLETHDRLAPDTRMHRYGASLMHDVALDSARHLATTLVWGMNLHHHSGSSHLLLHGDPNASPHHHASSLLLESSVDITSTTSLFGRLERVLKNGEELGFLGGDLTEQYDVRSLSLGATHAVYRFVRAGARGSVNLVPEILRATYSTRTPVGFAVFLQLGR